VLLPGGDALLPPPWVPWSERLRPGDLGVGDVLPTEPDDDRLLPSYVLSDDPAVAETATELGFGRHRVMSRLGRLDAADRWYTGDGGPNTPMAQQAAGHCGTCAFYLPIEGSLRALFGVCGNEYAPRDGRVVAADFGCGAHSETLVELSPMAPPPPLTYDDAALDVEPTDQSSLAGPGSVVAATSQVDVGATETEVPVVELSVAAAAERAGITIEEAAMRAAAAQVAAVKAAEVRADGAVADAADLGPVPAGPPGTEPAAIGLATAVPPAGEALTGAAPAPVDEGTGTGAVHTAEVLAATSLVEEALAETTTAADGPAPSTYAPAAPEPAAARSAETGWAVPEPSPTPDGGRAAAVGWFGVTDPPAPEAGTPDPPAPEAGTPDAVPTAEAYPTPTEDEGGVSPDDGA
jgi:Protein of unknown function (DUF3027)